MEKLDCALNCLWIVHCVWIVLYILIISIFYFLIVIHFTKQITLKPRLAQKLKLIFKFSTIMGYTIALEFWDEFNANFVLLYLLKLNKNVTPLSQCGEKCGEKQ